MEQLKAENEKLRALLDKCANELCLKCGKYHEAHNGACDGCKWQWEEREW